MTTTSQEPRSLDEREDMQPYRAVSKAAVMALILALLSVAGYLFAFVLLLALAASVFAIVAIYNLRRFPLELTGWVPAVAGLVLGTLIFISGVGFHAYVFATEVPEGYERVYFSQLQPEEDDRLPVPEWALQHSGENIFIKGYVHPGVQSQGDVRQFVLVPDMGTCCFGGQPKLTDMIEVTLDEKLRVRYSQRLRKLGGQLKVNTVQRAVAGGLAGGYYSLDADYLK